MLCACRLFVSDQRLHYDLFRYSIGLTGEPVCALEGTTHREEWLMGKTCACETANIHGEKGFALDVKRTRGV